jgi:hypothetical protein
VGPRAGLDEYGNPRHPPEFDPRTVQPVASRYTNYAFTNSFPVFHLNHFQIIQKKHRTRLQLYVILLTLIPKAQVRQRRRCSDLAMGWTCEESWFDSRHGKQNFVFPTVSKPVLGLSQPPAKRVPMDSFLLVKRPGLEAYPSPSSITEVMNEWI